MRHTAKGAPERDVVWVEHEFASVRLMATAMISGDTSLPYQDLHLL